MYLHKLRKKGTIRLPISKIVKNIFIGHGLNIYDNLVKIPLIFYHRKLVLKGVSPIQVRNIDIFPTIIDLLKLENSLDVTGKSLVPIMKGKEKKNRDAFIEASGSFIPDKEDWLAGIRIDNRIKFVYSPFRRDYKDELYFLDKDPREKKNKSRKNQILVKTIKEKINKLKIKEFVGEKLSDAEEKIVRERLKTLGYID